VMAFLILGEGATPLEIAGSAVVLVSIGLFTYLDARRR